MSPTLKIDERLRSLRAERDLTQDVVAKAAKVQPRTYGDWEKGETEPGATSILLLAEFFGVSADYLLGATDHRVGLAPDTWIADEDAIAYARAHRDKEVHWGFKVPRRLRLLQYHEYLAIRRDIGGNDNQEGE